MPQIRAVEIRLRVTRFCRSEINIMGRLQHSAHRQAAGSERQAQIGKNRCRQQERSTPALRCSHALRLLYPQEGRSSIVYHTRCAEHAAPPRAIGTQIHLQIPTGICTGNKKLCHIIAPENSRAEPQDAPPLPPPALLQKANLLPSASNDNDKADSHSGRTIPYLAHKSIARFFGEYLPA